MGSVQQFSGNGGDRDLGYLYRGSEETEDILLNDGTPYGSAWNGTVSTFIKGKGNDDIAYLTQSLNNLKKPVQFNELGITKITTVNTSYLLTGVEKLNLTDKIVNLGEGIASTSFLVAAVADYNQLIGPGTSSGIDNNNNLVVLPTYRNHSDILSNKDFGGGTDILVLPWASYRANISKFGSSWRISTDEGQTASYWNLEYIQFSDKAVRLNNNGSLSDIGFIDYAFNSPSSTDTSSDKTESNTNTNVQNNTTNVIQNNTTQVVNNVVNNYYGDVHNGDVNNNTINIGDNNTLGDLNVNSGSGTINTGEWSGKVFFKLSDTSKISEISAIGLARMIFMRLNLKLLILIVIPSFLT